MKGRDLGSWPPCRRFLVLGSGLLRLVGTVSASGENAQKTGENGERMSEIRSKKCEQGRDRRDQLDTLREMTLSRANDVSQRSLAVPGGLDVHAGRAQAHDRMVRATTRAHAFRTPGVSPTAETVFPTVWTPVPVVSWPWVPACGSLEPPRRGGENAQKTRKNGKEWARYMYGLKRVNKEETGGIN